MAGSGKAVVVFHVKVAIGLFVGVRQPGGRVCSRRVLLSLGSSVRRHRKGLSRRTFRFCTVKLGVSWKCALVLRRIVWPHVAVVCRPLVVRLGS